MQGVRGGDPSPSPFFSKNSPRAASWPPGQSSLGSEGRGWLVQGVGVALTASLVLVLLSMQVVRRHPVQEGGLHEALEGPLVRAGQDQAPGEWSGS